jgi:DNA-binding NarL/FixJ family response regulator
MFAAGPYRYASHMTARNKATPDTAVFLVEDSAIVRERLLQMFAAIPGIRLAGHADTAADALEQISRTRPDFLVLDIKLRIGSGMTVLQRVKQQMPDIVVVMLTNYATPEFRQRCMQSGADYFLDKSNEFQRIPAILQQRRNDYAHR